MRNGFTEVNQLSEYSGAKLLQIHKCFTLRKYVCDCCWLGGVGGLRKDYKHIKLTWTSVKGNGYGRFYMCFTDVSSLCLIQYFLRSQFRR